mgnify:CR=1 FL=1
MGFFTFIALFNCSFQLIEPLKRHQTSIMMQKKNVHENFHQCVTVLGQFITYSKDTDFSKCNNFPIDC